MENQITGSQNEPFFELLHPIPQKGAKKTDDIDILPSYDFQPIRSSTPNLISVDDDAAFGVRTGHSTAPASKHSSRVYNSFENELSKERKEQKSESYEVATMAAVERTVKKYVDSLLCSLEGISGRLGKLESATQHLESSMGELKRSVGNNHNVADRKLSQLENLLREVQTGVQVLRDRQEIAEAHSQLMKLQLSTSSHSISQVKPTDTQQQVGSATQPESIPSISAPPHQLSLVSAPPLPNAPPQQLMPASVQAPLPAQSQHQLLSTPVIPSESTFQPPMQQSAPPPQQYQVLPDMQQVPPCSIVMPPYIQQPQPQQSSPQVASPPYGQSDRPPHNPVHFVPRSQAPASLPPHNYGLESSYKPANYGGPNMHKQPQLTQPQLQPTAPSPQQLHGGQQMNELSVARPGSGPLTFPPGYGPSPAGLIYNDPQSCSGPPFRLPQSVTSAPGGGGAYSRLPIAQPVQHTLPIATSVSGSSSTGFASGNRAAVDDVIDKVMAMGFSRDQVRATMRRLTENGESIDLNIVLDKLMNDGEIQPQKGWFGQ